MNLNIGETTKNTIPEVTVFSAQKSNAYEQSSSHSHIAIKRASSGKTYVIANVEVKNNASYDMYVSVANFSIVDHDDYKYDSMMFSSIEDRLSEQKLFPNHRTRGNVVFEVPVSAVNLKVVYEFGRQNNVRLAYWRLPT